MVKMGGIIKQERAARRLIEVLYFSERENFLDPLVCDLD
jgi:hypothetical protein